MSQQFLVTEAELKTSYRNCVRRYCQKVASKQSFVKSWIFSLGIGEIFVKDTAQETCREIDFAGTYVLVHAFVRRQSGPLSLRFALLVRLRKVTLMHAVGEGET